MKRLNADGPPLPADRSGPPSLDVERFRRLASDGHVVVDLRSPVGFSGGHVDGALSVGIDPSLPVWASWVVPYDTPLLLVADRDDDVATALRAFARVGLDEVVGALAGGMDAWRAAGHPLRQTALMTPEQVHDLMVTECHLRILDVRGEAEWREGHIPGVVHVPVGALADRLDGVPGGDGPLAVVCGSGYRSTVAASILERNGLGPVINVVGGMRAWRQAGLPIMPERHDPARPVAP
ncbi:MAG: rhodanese-like domain-containing protein [Planctomycetota bacterium]